MAIEVHPRLTPGAELEAAEAELLAEWEGLPRGEKAQRFYDTRLFPLACERMRRIGASGPAAELAFVPVGTQPYSPILAALANPARLTLLLHTEGSRSHCEQVRAALADEPLRLEPRPIGDGTDGHRIARVVQGELVAAGLPGAEEVVVDVTSGRKATVAVLGAIAAVRGFRQGYIEGNPSRRHPTLFVNERYVAVANVRDYFREGERSTAMALLAAGSFAAASRLFLAMGTTSGAGARDLCLGHAAAGWAAWWCCEWQTAGRRLHRAYRLAEGEAARLLDRTAVAAMDLAKAAPATLLARHATGSLALAALRLGDPVRATTLLRAARLTSTSRRRDLANALRNLRRRLDRRGDVTGDLALLHDPVALAMTLTPLLMGEDR